MLEDITIVEGLVPRTIVYNVTPTFLWGLNTFVIAPSRAQPGDRVGNTPLLPHGYNYIMGP